MAGEAAEAVTPQPGPPHEVQGEVDVTGDDVAVGDVSEFGLGSDEATRSHGVRGETEPRSKGLAARVPAFA